MWIFDSISQGVSFNCPKSTINPNNLHLFPLHIVCLQLTRFELSTPKLSFGLLRPSASFCVGPAKSPSGFPLKKALESTLISEGGILCWGVGVDEALALLCLIRVSLGEKKTEMIYLLINESRKQMINIWLSNWQTLESQKQSQKQNESGVSLVTAFREQKIWDIRGKK